MNRDQHRMIELDERTCRALLANDTSGLGRVAFAEDGDPNWPTVLPVNYAYVDDAVHFRTFEGSKLYAALSHRAVAFEVDAIDDGWREGWSVVAVGELQVVRDADAVAAVDGVLTSWAAGEQEQVVRLRIRRLSGRRVHGPPNA